MSQKETKEVSPQDELTFHTGNVEEEKTYPGVLSMKTEREIDRPDLTYTVNGITFRVQRNKPPQYTPGISQNQTPSSKPQPSARQVRSTADLLKTLYPDLALGIKVSNYCVKKTRGQYQYDGEPVLDMLPNPLVYEMRGTLDESSSSVPYLSTTQSSFSSQPLSATGTPTSDNLRSQGFLGTSTQPSADSYLPEESPQLPEKADENESQDDLSNH